MRILVVDDELGFATLLGRTLRKLGHEALVSVHPLDAIQQLDGEIDALITDIDMPVMDGVQLAQVVRATKPDLPIAFCTGSDPAAEVVQRAAEIGTVLPKVWTIDEVMRAVERLRRQKHG